MSRSLVNYQRGSEAIFSPLRVHVGILGGEVCVVDRFGFGGVGVVVVVEWEGGVVRVYIVGYGCVCLFFGERVARSKMEGTRRKRNVDRNRHRASGALRTHRSARQARSTSVPCLFPTFFLIILDLALRFISWSTQLDLYFLRQVYFLQWTGKTSHLYINWQFNSQHTFTFARIHPLA